MIKFVKKDIGLTLIELMVAIAVSTILTGAVVFVLKGGLDAYFYSQEQILLEKVLDEGLDEVIGAGFEGYGIKDALEVLEISPTAIKFVPMWIDDSHVVKSEYAEGIQGEDVYTLNRPLKPGAALPIAEVFEPLDTSYPAKKGIWRRQTIAFIPPKADDPAKLDEKVYLSKKAVPGSRVRFIFQPDASAFEDCAVEIFWQDGRLMRRYKGDVKTIPADDIAGVKLSGFKMQYFDNTNTEVAPDKDNIANITAVKVNLTATLPASLKGAVGPITKGENTISKEGFTFVNLRNSRTAGRGLLIQKGSRIKIPDSNRVRMFSLANISGIKEAGNIELEARPKTGLSWKAVIELGIERDTPLIKRYSIEYPIGSRIHSQRVNLTTDTPLNFMNLSPSASYGLYGAGSDKKTIKVTGDVELLVTRMDAKGAMLFIRP